MQKKKDLEISEMKAIRGKMHIFLDMKFDFTIRVSTKVGMVEHVKKTIKDFSADAIK